MKVAMIPDRALFVLELVRQQSHAPQALKATISKKPPVAHHLIPHQVTAHIRAMVPLQTILHAQVVSA